MADKHKRKRPTNRRSQPRSRRLSDALISEASPSFNAWHIAEPRLIFAGSQTCEDPKTGLTIYGPAAIDSGPRTTIRLGVIGTGDTVQALRNWIRQAEGKILPGLNPRGKPYDPILAPDFPGFSLESPFQCEVQIEDRFCKEFTQSEIDACIKGVDFPTRTANMVALITERLSAMADKDPQPDVVVCAMPKDVEEACGPGARDGKLTKVVLTPAMKAVRKIKRTCLPPPCVWRSEP